LQREQEITLDREFFIGIDLAWGEKNPSGFCVLELRATKLYIISLELFYTLEDIVEKIKEYQKFKVSIGVDAPLLIPNEEGNREIEKAFNKDFSPYKIAMLPVNRKIMQTYSHKIRSEVLFEYLSTLGYVRDKEAKKRVFEVYPHATIAVAFNNYKILPYKRKKGRDNAFIKKQLKIYQMYLQKVCMPHSTLMQDLEILRGRSLKEYEDLLDAITAAYTLFFTQRNKSKYYTLEGVDTFVSPL